MGRAGHYASHDDWNHVRHGAERRVRMQIEIKEETRSKGVSRKTVL